MTTDTPAATRDTDKLLEMALRVRGYKQGEVVSLMVHPGDRLGLYRALREAGLRCQAAAGLVDSADGEVFERPDRAARAIRRCLKPDATWLVKEIRAGETWQDNLTQPAAALLRQFGGFLPSVGAVRAGRCRARHARPATVTPGKAVLRCRLQEIQSCCTYGSSREPSSQ